MYSFVLSFKYIYGPLKFKAKQMNFLYKLSIGLLLIVCNVNVLYSQITILPNKPGGVYEVGETVTWRIQMSDTIQLDSVRYEVKKGGLQIVDKGLISFKENEAQISHLFKEPGAILLDIQWAGKEPSWDNQFVGGAVASTDQIKLSADGPADFDEFWKSKIKELKSVPANPVLEKGESSVAGVDYWKINMDNIRGTKIRGQIAKPSEGKKFPALLIVQWAGVYPLQKDWITWKAKNGWLVLNINAHDLPIDKDEQFYKNQSQNELKNYPAIGNEDRNESYFLRMYLSCYRAAQYLTERPDWNGKTLVVMGTSQGGLQALMTAGIHPKITAAMALVPAGFDNLGPEIGRKGGWPQWYSQTENKDAGKVHETSKYYDVANFASRIKCPVLVGVGLLDQVCPPEGILAGLNQVTSPKEVIILPKSAHQDKDGSQDYYIKRSEEWLRELSQAE